MYSILSWQVRKNIILQYFRLCSFAVSFIVLINVYHERKLQLNYQPMIVLCVSTLHPSTHRHDEHSRIHLKGRCLSRCVVVLCTAPLVKPTVSPPPPLPSTANWGVALVGIPHGNTINSYEREVNPLSIHLPLCFFLGGIVLKRTTASLSLPTNLAC
jgi:hypothetical protein